MVISFHGVVFNSHKFIYAETMGAYVRIYLEGLPAQKDFVSVPAKTNTQAIEWLDDLTQILNNHYCAKK